MKMQRLILLVLPEINSGNDIKRQVNQLENPPNNTPTTNPSNRRASSISKGKRVGNFHTFGFLSYYNDYNLFSNDLTETSMPNIVKISINVVTFLTFLVLK